MRFYAIFFLIKSGPVQSECIPGIYSYESGYDNYDCFGELDQAKNTAAAKVRIFLKFYNLTFFF